MNAFHEMSPELDRALCASWPAIFVDRHGDPAHTAMIHGFTCGDGWYPLIDALCATLQREADQGGTQQPVAMQVKEKFGRLRVHLRTANERQRAMIEFAGDFSERICLLCGTMSSPDSALNHCELATDAAAAAASDRDPLYAETRQKSAWAEP